MAARVAHAVQPWCGPAGTVIRGREVGRREVEGSAVRRRRESACALSFVGSPRKLRVALATRIVQYKIDIEKECGPTRTHSSNFNNTDARNVVGPTWVR